jgi:large repetitive protein
VNGHTDDTVTITGATRTGTEARDGQTYDIYTLGTEGTLMIDDDINVVV